MAKKTAAPEAKTAAPTPAEGPKAPADFETLMGGINWDDEDDEPIEDVAPAAPAAEPTEPEADEADDEEHELLKETPEDEEAPAAEPAAKEEEDGEELEIELDDQTYIVEGARIKGDDVVIPKNIFETAIRPNLRTRESVEREWATAKAATEEAAASVERHPDVVAAKVLGGFFQKLMAKTPDQIADVLDQWPAYMARLKGQVDGEMQRIETETLRARLDAMESAPKQARFEATLASVVSDFASDFAQARGLSLDTKAAARDALNDLYRSGALTFTADRDGEFEGQTLKKGQVGLRVGLLEAWLGRYAAASQGSKQVAAVAKDVARATAANKRPTQKSPPPTVSAKGTPSAPARTAAPKSKQEFEAMLASLANEL